MKDKACFIALVIVPTIVAGLFMVGAILWLILQGVPFAPR